MNDINPNINAIRIEIPVIFNPNPIFKNLSFVKVGNLPITQSCSPSGRIKLVNGNGRVSCTVPISGMTAYTTPLEIRLEYGYKDFIRREVEIRGFG